MSSWTLARRLEWSVALAGAALAALIVWLGEDAAFGVRAVTLAVGALAVWIAVQDLKVFTISDSAILAIAVLAIAYRWSAAALAGDAAPPTLLAVGLDSVLPGGMLLLFREVYYRRKGFDGLGLGDVKLAAAGGLLVGAAGFSWALFAASLLALSFVGLSRLLAKTGRKPFLGSDKLAFGALLAPALWAVWIAQQMPMLLPYAER